MRIVTLAFGLVFTLSLSGCDCSGPLPGRPCASNTDCPDNERCVDEMCVPSPPDGGVDASDDADMLDDGEMPPADAGCTSDDQCTGGVCQSGDCCSMANVCGDNCCGFGETCFANACVIPGEPCRTSADCEDNQYCEPSLGESGSGGTAMPPHRCPGAAPNQGRCLDLPPECSDSLPPGTICIEACEYRPEVGVLNAVEQWDWNAETVVDEAQYIDIWSTPTVGRITDSNCDGVVNELDPPVVVFVSGDSAGTWCGNARGGRACRQGVLRVLDGVSGTEILSVREVPGSFEFFSAVSVAIGDVDHNGDMEILAVTSDGYIALFNHEGTLVTLSDERIIDNWTTTRSTGWGGGLSIGDMDHDGNPEIAYGRVIFTTNGTTVTRIGEAGNTWSAFPHAAISSFANLDDDPDLELLVGPTVLGLDTSGATPSVQVQWTRSDLRNSSSDGYAAPGDFDGDGNPEIVYVRGGRVYLLSATDGMDIVPSIAGTGSAGSGGPPTIADFDGDGAPEVGVAFRQYYEVYQLNADATAWERLWSTPNHDLSSSVTGSTVFDFEGDGAAEVIYNDECFLWVYDGATGAVRYATQTTSFTANEASLVADIDADGSAEILLIRNGASPSGWGCTNAPWTSPAMEGDPDFGRPGWVGSDGGSAAYRGLVALRASDNSWVGTRTLWNQHAYSVSNICGDRGDACTPPSTYGDIPQNQVPNWSVSFLNNFRQNIQGEGIFDAPDATVGLNVRCTNPVRFEAAVRNLGSAVLPAGVEVAVYLVQDDGTEMEMGRATTDTPLFPGQVSILEIDGPADAEPMRTYRARILVDPAMPTFRECRDGNNTSADVRGVCLG